MSLHNGQICIQGAGDFAFVLIQAQIQQKPFDPCQCVESKRRFEMLNRTKGGFHVGTVSWDRT